MASSKGISVTILSDEAEDIAQAIHQKMDENGDCRLDNGMPLIHIALVTSSPKAVDTANTQVLLADPDLAAEIVLDCHTLRWIQSTWAGNAPLLNLAKTDYLLTGLKGVFGKLMREYVFAYLLQHARSVSDFSTNQRASPPFWKTIPRFPLDGQTLGITGLGNIGEALIPVAHAFGMKVIGLSRSGRSVSGTEKMYTAETLVEFAQRSDHVVNLMPETPATQNLLSYDFFRALKPYSVFINAGRGSAINEEALLTCLNEQCFKHAVLDVFRQEPLGSAHPFWHHPRVSVTCHTAAESQPSDVATVFLDNAMQFILGRPLHYRLDFEKGY
ncbi:D-2-hydroxyacid dehydrogenase [Alteromonas sp. D210916BOD_24]|uniref:D-2-hydroxyacid dehydrogenase n=1 Tax=Alteromonas sp. D210916BOD_24 TaxID=3157618 RepID=UPI00399D088F